MKLKNILLVVKDIEKSKQFYHDLFGLDMILDNDGNIILTEGLVLQDEKIWRDFLKKEIFPKSNFLRTVFWREKYRKIYRKAGKIIPVNPICQSAHDT